MASASLFACAVWAVLLIAPGAHAARRAAKKAPECSRTCVAQNCDNALGLRYGKYCGVGYTGCDGEEPCDAYDACCKEHDTCVGATSMLDNNCHIALKDCLAAARKKGETPFTKDRTCPVGTLVETISSGMDLAIGLGGLGVNLGNAGGGGGAPNLFAGGAKKKQKRVAKRKEPKQQRKGNAYPKTGDEL